MTMTLADLDWISLEAAEVRHTYSGETGIAVRDPYRQKEMPQSCWYFIRSEQRGYISSVGEFVPFQEMA